MSPKQMLDKLDFVRKFRINNVIFIYDSTISIQI